MLNLIIESFTRPRPTIRTVLDWQLDLDVLIKSTVFLAIVYGAGAFLIRYFATDIDARAALPDPSIWAGLELLELLIVAFLIYYVGRMAGGTADFGDALSVTLWLELIQIIPIFGVLILGLTGNQDLVQLAFVVVAITILVLATIYISEAHGFENIALTGLGVFVGGFVFNIAAFPVLVAAGIVDPGAIQQ